jgi:hypothetical protein
MRAREAYRLIVRRGGLMPAILAHHERVDHVEIVEVDSGEVILYWDCPAQRARELVRMLREELSQMDAEDFLDRWIAVSD